MWLLIYNIIKTAKCRNHLTEATSTNESGIKTKYLDNYRSDTLVNTEIGAGPTSILFGKLPHDLNRLLSWLTYNKHTNPLLNTTVTHKSLPIDHTLQFLSHSSKIRIFLTIQYVAYNFSISISIHKKKKKWQKGRGKTFGGDDVAAMQGTRRVISDRWNCGAQTGGVRGGCL